MEQPATCSGSGGCGGSGGGGGSVVVGGGGICMCVCVTDSKGPDTNTLGIKLLSNVQRDNVKNGEKIAWLHGDVT